MPKKKASRKPIAVGFAVTVVALSVFTFALLYNRPGVPVTHVSSQAPEYSPMWGAYVPSGAIQFGFENYSAIRSYNSSYPTQYEFLLNIVDVGASLKKTSIDSVLSVTFEKPNASAVFAFVNKGAWANFTNAFAKAGVAATMVGRDSLFYVRNSEQGQFQYGWIALAPKDHAIGFALGDVDAKTALTECLQTTPSTSSLSRLDIRQMLSLVNGTDHLAVGLQGIPGVIPAANDTLTVVDDSGTQVLIHRVLEFRNSTLAVQLYNVVKQDYLDSRVFAVFD